MDLKVIKGNVVFGDTTYATNEIISGVDQDTADYLLMLKVAETAEPISEEKAEENETAEETDTAEEPNLAEDVPAAKQTAPAKSKSQAGPKTSLD